MTRFSLLILMSTVMLANVQTSYAGATCSKSGCTENAHEKIADAGRKKAAARSKLVEAHSLRLTRPDLRAGSQDPQVLKSVTDAQTEYLNSIRAEIDIKNPSAADELKARLAESEYGIQNDYAREEGRERRNQKFRDSEIQK